MRILAIATLLLKASAVCATPAGHELRAGDVFEISRDIESSSKTTGGESTGSSTDRDTIEERVIATSQAGLELQYDLPKGTTAEDRARQWQLPASVLKLPNGPLQLLDGAELAGRVAAWLKAAGLTEAACGHWYFTWNAFRIECDPNSVIKTLEGFDLGPDDMAEGVLYRDPEALGSAPVKRTAVSPGGEVFHVALAVDPDAVRRDLAQSDVAVGEISRRPVTYEEALRARSNEDISGTIDITFETDPAGHVLRQTKVTTLNNMRGFMGRPEIRTSTETLERRLISEPGA
ncbi:MAG: hypothetical protein ACHP7N_02120 [Caulobacterales bacterium]